MSFKPKVGRRAMTRDGRVAFVSLHHYDPLHPNEEFLCGIITGDKDETCWLPGGRISSVEEHAEDLVAPYKPKRREPKVGDRVEIELLEPESTFPGRGTDCGEITKIVGDIFYLSNTVYLHPFLKNQIVKFLNKADSK